MRRRVGYVIQDGGLFPHLTADENVTLVARLSDGSDGVKRGKWLKGDKVDDSDERIGRRRRSG